MNNDKIFEYCNTMIAVVCTLFPFGCCIQINHYSTSTSFSLFVRILYVQFQGGGECKYLFYTKVWWWECWVCRALCPHVLVLARDREVEIQNKIQIYIIYKYFISTYRNTQARKSDRSPIRPNYILAVAIKGHQLFCISSAQCIVGKSVVFEWSSPHELPVF
jgi:hypothetical protein